MKPHSNRRSRILTLLIAAGILALCLTGCGGRQVAPIVDAIAPGFTLPTIDGDTVALEELRGQPVLLTFATTNCGWCSYQTQFLQAAYEDKGDEVHFVTVDIGQTSGTVQQFAQSLGLEYTIALDQDAAVAIAYNIRGIPKNFIIDEQGVIRYVKTGAFLSEEEVLAVLDGL